MGGNFIISRPSEADWARIAEIHLAAMDENPLLHAQFPTPNSLTGLRAFLESLTASQLHAAAEGTPTSGILVARDADTGTIASFAKWVSPNHPEDGKVEESLALYERAEGCRREFLDGYAALAEQTKKRCFGDGDCYRTCLPRSLISPPFT
jgi:hypothetical protein